MAEKQNVHISRMNIAGAIQSTSGTSTDANKVVKTDANGLIDPSFISGGITSQNLENVAAMPDNFRTWDDVAGLIVETNGAYGGLREFHTEWESYAANQTAVTMHKFRIPVDNVRFKDPAYHIKYASNFAAPAVVNVRLTETVGSTFLQEDSLTDSGTTVTEVAIAKNNTATFNTGDFFNVVIRMIDLDAGEWFRLCWVVYHLETF